MVSYVRPYETPPPPQMTATTVRPAATEQPANLYSLTLDAYRLEAAIAEAAEGLVSDDPEVAAAATAELEALLAIGESTKDALQAKADAWCWVISRLRDQATTRREHAARLVLLAQTDERKADAMLERLTDQLLFLSPGETKFDLPSHQLRSTKVTTVEIDDDLLPEDLPAEYQRSKTTTQIDRVALKAALKGGAVVPGASLLEHRSWRLG
ncbi:MAG: hypothetical protein EBZ51_07525 [Synechococcaceae bacterium WB9_2_112]|nr:hypothetical protein [Synechococcaceae bacterium WB9_2_112]